MTGKASHYGSPLDRPNVWPAILLHKNRGKPIRNFYGTMIGKANHCGFHFAAEKQGGISPGGENRWKPSKCIMV